MLPKSRYAGQPVSTADQVSVPDWGTHWALKARATRAADLSVPATVAAAQPWL
jgi:hypothetical protein